MKSTKSLLLAAVTVLSLSLSFFTAPAFSASRVNPAFPINSLKNEDYTALYRLYNSQNKLHLYTTSCEEKNTVTQSGGYIYEGIAGYVAIRQMRRTTPLYRLYLSSGEHFYTTNDAEMRTLTQNPANRLVATVGYLATSQARNTQPFYRLAGVDRHFYTTNESEKNTYLQTGGNKDEGVSGYIWTAGLNSCDSGSTGDYPVVYSRTDFSGASQIIEKDWNVSDDWDGSPNIIGAIRVPRGSYVVIYAKRNFRGKSFVMSNDAVFTRDNEWYNRIRSIKVYKGELPPELR